MARGTGSHTVFLTYSSVDRRRGNVLARRLAQYGFPVRRIEQYVRKAGGPLDLGDQHQFWIRWQAEAADSLLVLISSDTPANEEQLRTLDLGMDQRGVDVIPVILGPASAPEPLRGRAGVNLTGEMASLDELVQRIYDGRALDLLDLTPTAFERLVEDILRSEGLDVRTPRGKSDGGYDFVATMPGTDTVPPTVFLVEAKAYRNDRVSVAAVRKSAGRVAAAGGGEAGLIVTNGQLTSVAAQALARLAPEIRVLDGIQVKHLLLKHPELVRKYGQTQDGESR